MQGGVETHCEQLYPCMARHGHDIFVFGRQNFLASREPYTYQGCRILPTPHPHNFKFEALVHSLTSVVRAKRLRPDIVHIHAIGPALVVPFARLLGLRVVVTHHGMDYLRKKWGLLARTMLRLGEWCAAHFANHVVVISKSIQRQVLSLSPRQRTSLIPNGVRLPSVSAPEVSEEFRRSGLAGQTYIFALGRFVAEKGFHDLLEAYARLGRADVRLVLAGDADHPGEYSEALKRRAGELGVLLTGFIKGPYLDDLFRHASLFVIPSYHEGLPIALLEAMSYDLKVVASDIEPHQEMELPADCYFPVGNIDKLADKINEVLEKTSVFAFRHLLEQKYNWENIADQTLEVYHNVLH